MQDETLDYEAPQVIELGDFADVTAGNYSKSNSDDSEAGKYYEP
jgi:hypothetical protein